jgi:Mrp family chromosome partitioning ATPase
MLDEILQEYDQVLLDGAPCLVVSDSPVLSTVVDGVVLVVRAGANTHGTVQRVRGILDHVGARILGSVLNGVRVTAGGYLRKSYDTFYEYHEQMNLPTKS